MELNQKGILLVLSGPSGSGKGTIVSQIVAEHSDFSLSVSLTTRAPRPHEIDGVHYSFVDRDEFTKQIEAGNMLEYTEYCDNLYGTHQNQVNTMLDQGINVILEIEIEGALNIKKLRPDAVLVMILPPSYEVLENRLRSRGTNTEEDIQKRLATAKKELEYLSDYHYCVINETGKSDIAAKEVCDIIAAERHKLSRNSDILENFYAKQ